MVAGPGVQICDECVAQCVEIMKNLERRGETEN